MLKLHGRGGLCLGTRRDNRQLFHGLVFNHLATGK
jgi:hypothetical protein